MVRTKRAWRKSEKATEVVEKLHDLETEKRLGGIISEKTDEQLFTVDASGCEKARRQVKSQILTVDEILKPKSDIPAVPPRKIKKKRAKELKVLKKYQKKLSLPNPVKLQEKKTDIWETESSSKPSTPFSAHAVLPAVQLGSQGISYNPNKKDHEQEIISAAKIELDRIQEQQEAVKQLDYDERLLDLPDMEDEANAKLFSISDEEEDTEMVSEAPVIPVVRAENKKSRTVRNRERKLDERAKELAEMKKIKSMQKEIGRIGYIRKEIKAESKDKKERLARRIHAKEINALKPKRLGKEKFNAPFPVIKLSDEIPSVLRQLKPEGSLLKERFASLQARNLIEPRNPTNLKHRYRKVTYEKHSYKAFK